MNIAFILQKQNSVSCHIFIAVTLCLQRNLISNKICYFKLFIDKHSAYNWFTHTLIMSGVFNILLRYSFALLTYKQP